jgi:hypothetical protein
VPAAKESAASAPAITAVRLGDHGDTTRIVLDAAGKPGYAAHLEEGGRRLVVELPRAEWAAAQKAALRNSRVGGYEFADGKAVFDLPAPLLIKSQQLLPPQGKAGYRIVIDLAAAPPG